MKRLRQFLLLGLFCAHLIPKRCGPCRTWLKVIQQASLIIEGQLVAIENREVKGENRRIGIIEIKKHYKDSYSNKTVPIELPGTQPLVSTDIHYRVGDAGIWILIQQTNGLYSANAPYRFWPPKKYSQIKPLLRDETTY